ncbi:MAG: hypothetical protein ACRC10_01545 [Thermoguttaceae bacterium]
MKCFWMTLMIRIVLILGLSTQTVYADKSMSVDQLPKGNSPVPIQDEHFPSPQYTFVFRNWTVVPVERIAQVLKTEPENVRRLAESLGLPPNPVIPAAMHERGYLSIIRRNWQLLPYSQLLELLGWTPEEMAFSLREDDFLFVKLGNVKPNCSPIVYSEPTEEEQKKAQQIRGWIASDFGVELLKPGEPRFDFVRQLSEPIAEKGFPIGFPPTSPRYLYSYFALFGDPLLNPELDSFPEGYLARLSQVGVDGFWMHIVLRQLTPGGDFFPEFGEEHEKRLENLNKLVKRAAKYHQKVYLYLNEPRSMPLSFFEKHPDVRGVQEGEFAALCTSDREQKVLRWIEESLAYLFAKVPDLGGVFTISGSENLTFCSSHGNQKACPRCCAKSEAELVGELHAAIERGVHRGNPDAKVIVWDWGWNGHQDGSEMIRRLPKNVQFLSVSEWSLPITRGGVTSTIGEYSISAVGPGPRALAHWKLAKELGIPTLAKVQLNNSWELASIPYLPVLELTARHCKGLAEIGVSGMMLGWSLGGYPSPNLEIAYRFAVKPTASIEEVLDAVAEKRFGQSGKEYARKAWSLFSTAFEEYPYGSGLYTAPVHLGPANLLYRTPTGYAPTMSAFPYDGLASWVGPYGPDVYADQMQKMADGWNAGIVELTKAVELAPIEMRGDALIELHCALVGALSFAGVANQCRFIQLRDQLSQLEQDSAHLQTSDSQESMLSKKDQQHREQDIKRQMREILQREIEAARLLFEIARDDSRIGFEASNHYFYVPFDLVEKVVNCRMLLEQIK